MTRWLEVVVLLLAGGAAVAAILEHRRGRSSAPTAWGLRGTVLLSLSMIVGTAPQLLTPSLPWLHVTGIVLSFCLTGASMMLVRRQYRAQRSSSRQ